MSSSVSNGSMRGPGPGLPGRGTRARAIPIASPIARTTAVHNAGFIPHFRSLGCTPITSGFHVLHDAFEDGPMAFHGGREEVHLSVPLSRGRDETILPEDAKMVPDGLVVQDQGPRELLRVPRFIADREQDPGPWPTHSATRPIRTRSPRSPRTCPPRGPPGRRSRRRRPLSSLVFTS